MKYAFVVEGHDPWTNSNLEPIGIEISVYEITDFPTNQVVVPTHNVKGTLNLESGFKVDGAYFKDGVEFFYIKVDPIRQFEVNSERWIKLVGWGKSIFVTDGLNVEF